MMYLGVAVYLVLSVGGLALFKAGATGASSWTQVLHSLKAVAASLKNGIKLWGRCLGPSPWGDLRQQPHFYCHSLYRNG